MTFTRGRLAPDLAAAGFVAHRFGSPRVLLAGAALTFGSGVAMFFAHDLSALLIAFVGTLNPTTSDVTLFGPIEHALLSQSTSSALRTAVFARYSVVGSLLVPFMPALEFAVALLCVCAFFSNMDVPARSSYVRAVVSPEKRAAAASVTAVPRSIASAARPAVSGYLLGISMFSWPLVIAGAIKVAYDLLLLAMFGRVKPPEQSGK